MPSEEPLTKHKIWPHVKPSFGAGDGIPGEIGDDLRGIRCRGSRLVGNPQVRLDLELQGAVVIKEGEVTVVVDVNIGVERVVHSRGESNFVGVRGRGVPRDDSPRICPLGRHEESIDCVADHGIADPVIRPGVCVIGRRGRPTRLDKGVPSVILEPRGAHSSKPEKFYEVVERLNPGPYVDLYGRASRSGWVTWGDQAGG